jgi:hypothetical protein
MSLEGLRAWIGEVERKLAKRTRVFLALTVIAIGIGGAAVYLAIDARESSVSESDVQALQQRLEARIDALAALAATSPAGGEAEAESQQQAPSPTPEAQPEGSKKGEGGTGDGATGSAPSGATGSAPSGATGGDASAAKLQELLREGRERAEESK